MRNIIQREFYQRDTVEVARDLLGALLVRVHDGKLMSGIIAETEAYAGEFDPASHTYNGKTVRNVALFGPVGHSYVYLSYGIHHCLNLVARPENQMAGGVLIRGLIPVEGIEHMQHYRNTARIDRLTNGPGNVGQALQFNLNHNHIDVTTHGQLYVLQGKPIADEHIRVTPRIGISKAQEYPWRFVLDEAHARLL
jgi:DNA-3-methyladenine glycosylase